MVQHVLLMLVAAPLLALAAPITLILRVSSPETRRRWVLPVLHSRVMRFLAHPVTAWLMFAVMMWAVHSRRCSTRRSRTRSSMTSSTPCS